MYLATVAGQWTQVILDVHEGRSKVDLIKQDFSGFVDCDEGQPTLEGVDPASVAQHQPRTSRTLTSILFLHSHIVSSNLQDLVLRHRASFAAPKYE